MCIRDSIIADRHIHMTPEDAARFGVSDGELVAVKIEGVKSGIMENVIIRVSDRYRLDFHIDTDDGNAFMMSQGQEVTLIKLSLIHIFSGHNYGHQSCTDGIGTHELHVGGLKHRIGRLNISN